MCDKLASFKHQLQDWMRLDDREWRYTIPNPPGPDKLDNARLIKTVSLFMTGGKHEINLTLVKAEDNRAIRVTYSSLITEDAARGFQLNHHSIHWKCIYNSSTRDRLGTFLDTTSKALETFNRKLIILQVDKRLTVAIYVPRKIETSQDSLVDDTVRLFVFPHTQGTERQCRMTIPTKMTYRLYCDERQFQQETSSQ